MFTLKLDVLLLIKDLVINPQHLTRESVVVEIPEREGVIIRGRFPQGEVTQIYFITKVSGLSSGPLN